MTSGGVHVEGSRVLYDALSAIPEPSTMGFAALGLLDPLAFRLGPKPDGSAQTLSMDLAAW